MKHKTLILSVIILLSGAGITYMHLTYMFYYFNEIVSMLKIICLGCIMLLSVQMIKAMVKNCTTPVKYIVLCIAAVLITLGFTLLNTFWHYIAFRAEPDFPIYLFPYSRMLKIDMLYNKGYVVFRYVIIFIGWILLFWLPESSLAKKAFDFVRNKIKDFWN